MTRSERVTENVVRVLVAPLVGLIAGALTAILIGLVLSVVPVPTSRPLVWHGSMAMHRLAVGFAFVFAGSLIVPKGWRLAVAFILIGIGITLSLYMGTHYSSEPNEQLRVWPVIPSVGGGLLAVAVLRLSKHA